jgi:simple sugar transport system permease protein
LAYVGSGLFLGLPVPVWLWIATGIVAGLVVRRTALGLLIESVGVNLRASRLAGVNSTVLLLTVYMASGLCAAIAGVIVTGDIRGADANNAGLWLELDAILAVAIGGTSLLGGRFSILASLIGAMIIQSINTGILLAGFPPEFNLVIKAALVLLILMLQSPRLGALASGLVVRRRLADEAGAAPRTIQEARR